MLTTKKNESVKFIGKWMELETFTLTKKDRMLFLICGCAL